MHYLAIRKPRHQFRYVPDVNRKLYTRPFAAAEAGNLLQQNSSNSAERAIGLLDPTRSFHPQCWTISRLDLVETPKYGVQAGQIPAGKAELDHFVHIPVDGQIAHGSLEKVLEIPVPSFAEKPRVRESHHPWAHRKNIVPERAAAAMWTIYKYWRLHPMQKI